MVLTLKINHLLPRLKISLQLDGATVLVMLVAKFKAGYITTDLDYVRCSLK